MMKVNIKLGPHGTMPVQREGDAGSDVHAAFSGIVQAGQTVKCELDFAIELPPGYEAQIRPRSGLSLMGRTVVTGTIDESYRGTVAAILHNTSRDPWHYRAGERVAQLVIAPIARVTFEACAELSDTSRAGKGFGSSGV